MMTLITKRASGGKQTRAIGNSIGGSRTGNLNRQRLSAIGFIGFSIFAFLAFTFRSSSSSNNTRTQPTNGLTMATTATIVSGAVNGIPYDHCPGNTKHLVLLHGARFTKKDWKTSGIMDQFSKYEQLSATALDLPVSAGHQELKTLLESMQAQNLVQLPVALVTPSASGNTMSDWMMYGDVTELSKYVDLWIPVAPGSVSQANDSQVRSLTGNLSIFAIYGNKDTMGKVVSTRLGALAEAKVLELKGGHPCYLDSPNEFTAAVVQALGVTS